MEKRIEVAAVQIVAHQQALLQQPDPAIANKTLLRVPEDLSGCDYSAQDFETCWSLGATEFEDRVWLSRGHALSKDDMRKIGEYIFVNRLEPQSVDSWILGHDRLVAAGVIKPEAPKTQTPVKHEPQAPKLIDIEKINSSTPEGRRQLREAHWNNILVESQPTVDAFIADLNSRGKFPTYDERMAMAAYIQNHNLWPNQIASWRQALANVTPQYLTEEDRAIRDMDRNDSITSTDLKKALGTASYRIAVTVPNR